MTEILLCEHMILMYSWQVNIDLFWDQHLLWMTIFSQA